MGLIAFILANVRVYSPILDFNGRHIPCKEKYGGGTVVIIPFPDLRIMCINPNEYSLDSGGDISELTEGQKNEVRNRRK